MDFKSRFLESLKTILSSKKVLMTLAGLVVGLLAKHNILLSEGDVTLIVTAIVTAVGGQAIADVGKHAAEVKAANPPPAPIAAGGDVIVEAPK